MRTIHGTLKRLLCALYYRYRTCCVVHAGRRCAPSCVDADKTWSITGALGVMAAALPARAGLRYLLTAVRQALKDRSSWLRQTRTFSQGGPPPCCRKEQAQDGEEDAGQVEKTANPSVW